MLAGDGAGQTDHHTGRQESRRQPARVWAWGLGWGGVRQLGKSGVLRRLMDRWGRAPRRRTGRLRAWGWAEGTDRQQKRVATVAGAADRQRTAGDWRTGGRAGRQVLPTRPGPGRGRARWRPARGGGGRASGRVWGAVGCGGIMKNSRRWSRPSASIRGDGT